MRFAIIITSGIGNALLLIPLIKELQKRGSVTCISASPFHAEKVFDGFSTKLFESLIDISSNAKAAAVALKRRGYFDEVYLDFFAGGRKNLLLASAIGKKVITNRPSTDLPEALTSSIQFIAPKARIHESQQYLRLFNPQFENNTPCEEQFLVNAIPPVRALPDKYLTIQPGSGNNLTPWKTWPVDRWIETMHWLLDEYPTLQLVVLGDDSEDWMHRQMDQLGPRVLSLIGQTKLEELPAIIAGATLHLGGDSGLLHIAGCLGISTATIWGGSDPAHFGWNVINPEKHLEIRIEELSCHPCNRWIEPNTSKATTPNECPDFACIRGINAAQVQEGIRTQLNKALRIDAD